MYRRFTLRLPKVNKIRANSAKPNYVPKRTRFVVIIISQPAHSTATINPDGKTVQFQLNPGVNPAELGTEGFTYSVSLEPSPKNQSMISTAMCLVTFTDYRNGSHASSECMGGRRLGPAPSVTDER